MMKWAEQHPWMTLVIVLSGIWAIEYIARGSDPNDRPQPLPPPRFPSDPATRGGVVFGGASVDPAVRASQGGGVVF